MGTLAYLTPEVLGWARESVGYSLEVAAQKINIRPEKLADAEAGEVYLTLRQAERAAVVYDRPLAALYLPTPPTEEPQEQQFRRLPGAPRPPWPPEMQILARRVRERQDAALELYDVLDEEPPWGQTLSSVAAGEAVTPSAIRELLGISISEQQSWHDQAGYKPLRAWTDAVERLGVLVLQDGTLPLDLMRGFASPHPEVPVIVVNTQDDARARAFTIIHELGHLCLAATGQPVGPETEQWCDEFAGALIMPREYFSTALSRQAGRTPIVAIDAVALEFGVTPYAAAVRAALARLLSQDAINGAVAEIRRRGVRSSKAGGNYYLTQIGRLSPAFASLVLTALDSQAVTAPAASSLLDGVKVSNFGALRDYLGRRMAEA
ncbi:MAG: ImmA/IrrE family metallo-endopeptidase [Solirubrobacteraceae bacterium]